MISLEKTIELLPVVAPMVLPVVVPMFTLPEPLSSIPYSEPAVVLDQEIFRMVFP